MPRTIAKVVHDLIDNRTMWNFPSEITDFESGTGNTVGFITDNDGSIWRIVVQDYTSNVKKSLCAGSLKADGPCLHGEFDVHSIAEDSYEYLMPTKESHPCPYEEDVNNDATTFCFCSPAGMQNCRDDI